MIEFIPPFDWQVVVLNPWTEDFDSYRWITLMGFFVASACGLVGNYLLLRRLSLIGDAISHSILPGLALGFMVFKTTSIWASFVGALLAALGAVYAIEFIGKHSRIKPDASTCIVFTTFFAFGVALISTLEASGSVHLDAECVLYGELSLVQFEEHVFWRGHDLGPLSLFRMGSMLLLVVILIWVFFKELMITSFDPALATALGMDPGLWHYGLMGILALIVVSSFEAVGAILVVAMLIIPPMFAAQLCRSLTLRLVLIVLHSGASSLAGLHLSLWLNCSTASAMVIAGAILFLAAWGWSVLSRCVRTGVLAAI